jgi:hypothetical protein
MNRTLGIEKTIKPRDYESVKVSSFITDIPDSAWAKEGWFEDLAKLVTAQTYKILLNERLLDKELKDSEGTPSENLDALVKVLLAELDLENIIINLNVEIK